MKNIVDLIKSMPDYIGSNGRSEEEIANAENEIGITFADDYREYLKKIGLACFDGHELTGLTKTERLSVVSVTMEQRKLFGESALTWYVVEEADIDGIVIWQASDGAVYVAAPWVNAEKVADSLYDYYSRDNQK